MAVLNWINRFFEREFVALVIVLVLTYNLAMAGKLDPTWATVVVPAGAFIWKRTKTKK